MSALADAWARWMIEAALASTAVFAVVALLWLAVRRRASAHTGSWLWLLPLLPLLVPVGRLLPRELAHPIATPALEKVWAAIGAPLSPGEGTGAGDEEVATLEPSLGGEADPSPASERGQLLRPAPAASAAPGFASARVDGRDAAPSVLSVIRPLDLAFGCWLGVVCVLLTLFLRSQLRVHRMVRAARALQPEILGIHLPRLLRQSGLRAPVRIAATEALASPATWGLRRPVVLLPEALLQRGHPDGLSFVILHELAHVRRRDLLLRSAQQVLQILYFFHPFLWITHRAVDGLRECACDDAALARRPGRARLQCAAAFLEVLEHASRRQLAAPGGLPLFLDERRELRRRMMNLMNPRHRAARGLSPGSVAILLAGVALAAPAAGLVAARAPDAAAAGPGAVAGPGAADGATEVAASQSAADSLKNAASWLVRAQQADGSWSAGENVTGSGEFNNVGVTGLALLALLETPDFPTGDPGKRAVQSGLAYLRSIQDESGRFGPAAGWHFQSSHAVALLAWLRGRELLDSPVFEGTAQRAVEYILRSRNPYRGWRYVPRDGDNDSFVTSLMLWALIEAGSAGLEVQEDALVGGYSFLDSMTDPATGRTGFNRRGSPVSRLVDKVEAFPPEHSEMLTAMALFVRSLDARGAEPGDVRARAVALLNAQPPRWDQNAGTIDFYYWWFGAKALARTDLSASKRWADALREALLPHQRDQRGESGSWPACDAWSSDGATVHATALCALTLAALQP